MKKLKQFFSGCRSILCLDGNIDSIREIDLNVPIIAADGAAGKLFEKRIYPEAIVGDLDSFDIADVTKLDVDNLNINIILDTSQSTNDFQKAMVYLEANSLLPAVVVGINGGDLDHILNNMAIFSGSGCVLLDRSIVGVTLQQGVTRLFDLEKNTKLSIFGMPRCHIFTNGLKWELKNAFLHFPDYTSCFNRAIKNQVSITVEEGTAMVFIYLETVNDCGIQCPGCML